MSGIVTLFLIARYKMLLEVICVGGLHITPSPVFSVAETSVGGQEMIFYMHDYDYTS